MPSQGSPGPEPGAGLLRPGRAGDSPSGFSHLPSSQKGHLQLAPLHPGKALPSPRPRIQVRIAFKTKVKATSKRTPCHLTALGLRAAQLTVKSEAAGLFKPSLGGEPSPGRPAEPTRVKPPRHRPPPPNVLCWEGVQHSCGDWRVPQGRLTSLQAPMFLAGELRAPWGPRIPCSRGRGEEPR